MCIQHKNIPKLLLTFIGFTELQGAWMEATLKGGLSYCNAGSAKSRVSGRCTRRQLDGNLRLFF